MLWSTAVPSAGQATVLFDCEAPAALSVPADSDALQFALDSCGSGAGCTVLLSRPLDLPKPVVWSPAAGAFATARGMLRGARGGKGRLVARGKRVWFGLCCSTRLPAMLTVCLTLI